MSAALSSTHRHSKRHNNRHLNNHQILNHQILNHGILTINDGLESAKKYHKKSKKKKRYSVSWEIERYFIMWFKKYYFLMLMFIIIVTVINFALFQKLEPFVYYTSEYPSNLLNNIYSSYYISKDCSCLNDVYDKIFVISIKERIDTLKITLFQLNAENIKYELWEGHSKSNRYSMYLWNLFRLKINETLQNYDDDNDDYDDDDDNGTDIDVSVSSGDSGEYDGEYGDGDDDDDNDDVDTFNKWNSRRISYDLKRLKYENSAYKNKHVFFLRQTQIDILKYSLKMGYKKILLLEDDILIANPFEINRFCKFEPLLPSWLVLGIGINQYKPWDIRNGGKLMNITDELHEPFKFYVKNEDSMGLFGVSFSYEMYRILINLFDFDKNHIDYYYQSLPTSISTKKLKYQVIDDRIDSKLKNKQNFLNLYPLDNYYHYIQHRKSLWQRCLNVFKTLILPDVTVSTLRKS